MNYDDPLDLSGQEIGRAAQQTQRSLAADQEALDFKWLMGSESGRRIVWRILEESGVFRSSFHPTAMQMAFNEGRRNYGAQVLALVHLHAPELYARMTKENANGSRKPRDNTKKR